MSEPRPAFFQRLSLALSAFWRVLNDPDCARRLDGPQPVETPQPAPALREMETDSALQLLGLLQQEGRLVDFLQEDVRGFSDAEIGGAARVVHEGCRKVLREHLSVEPVRGEAENARVTLEAGFDAASHRLTGNVAGEAPFTGTLVHRGWRVTAVTLPRLAGTHDVRILAPAEVEL